MNNNPILVFCTYIFPWFFGMCVFLFMFMATLLMIELIINYTIRKLNLFSEVTKFFWERAKIKREKERTLVATSGKNGK